ncbi:hypothetical protein Pan216_12610 [Planctomycetes bacterium Pan216]|uniref:Carboxypeptidase regulatory-like domain-containing protein n=1 Tax=Kolteria novifilia TaxID=2527975 RepID=A0A518B0G2_9BACT|nr:hypothetical protein Pan216_12610 [Planctomycetes bacterium Pan216]
MCLTFVGCGGNEYGVVPVSGRVTLNGQPCPDVSLTFVPLAEDKDNPNVGPGSLGRTDSEGNFTLQTVKGGNGAVSAEHVVRISISLNGNGDEEGTPDIPGKPTREITLPSNASDGSLRFKVPEGGTDQANFDLVSKRK